jgi:hypothetical protein
METPGNELRTPASHGALVSSTRRGTSLPTAAARRCVEVLMAAVEKAHHAHALVAKRAQLIGHRIWRDVIVIAV